MLSRCDLIKGAAVALLTLSTQGAWAQETKMNLFKIVTIKDEIIIGLSPEELQALGGNDASAVAHALAQKGDLTVWQYNVHRGQNGEMQQAPTAKIGLLGQRLAPRRALHHALPDHAASVTREKRAGGEAAGSHIQRRRADVPSQSRRPAPAGRGIRESAARNSRSSAGCGRRVAARSGPSSNPAPARRAPARRRRYRARARPGSAATRPDAGSR